MTRGRCMFEVRLLLASCLLPLLTILAASSLYMCRALGRCWNTQHAVSKGLLCMLFVACLNMFRSVLLFVLAFQVQREDVTFVDSGTLCTILKGRCLLVPNSFFGFAIKRFHCVLQELCTKCTSSCNDVVPGIAPQM
jgi:hypothetical protein